MVWDGGSVPVSVPGVCTLILSSLCLSSVRTQAGTPPVFPHLPVSICNGGHRYQQHQYTHQHVFK